MTPVVDPVERPTEAATESASPWRRPYLGPTLAAVSLVTLAAFEDRAVVTVLPLAARELDAMRWFGLLAVASMVSYLVATALAGSWSDRAGARRVLVGGLVAFVVAQVVTGTAAGLPALLLGRVASGTAEAAIDISLVVLVAETVPASLRPRVFALFAAAWVLPSVVGPPVAGVLAATAGWRMVFLIPLLGLLPAAARLRPFLRRRPRPAPAAAGSAGTGGNSEDRLLGVDEEAATPTPGALGSGPPLGAVLGLAAGVALLSWGAGDSGGTGGSGGPGVGSGPPGWLVMAVGGVATALALRQVLPAGTVRARRGLPALIVVRALIAASFTLIGAYLPLLLTVVRPTSPALTGSSLAVTGCFWALGARVASSEQVRRRLSSPALVTTAMATMTVDALGPVLLCLDVVGLGVGMAGFAVCAVSRGIVGNVTTTALVELAEGPALGRTQSAAYLADAVGAAVAVAAGGAVIAVRAEHLTGSALALIAAGGAVLAGLTALLAPRIGSVGRRG